MNDPEKSSDANAETANIHLQLAGQTRTVAVEFRPGEQVVSSLLPIARELTQHITGLAIESAARQRRTVSCRAGCAACCRQMVAISLVDAQSLAKLVASLPAERQAILRDRFAAAIARLEDAGLLDPSEPQGNRRLVCADEADPRRAMPKVAARYFQLQIACPFLEDECCSIYGERPLVCREYHVTSPAANCARLYEIGVDPVEMPVRMGDVLVQVAHQVAGVSPAAIPLVLALEWALAHPQALAQPADSLAMLRTMMTAIDQECAQSFAERPRDS